MSLSNKARNKGVGENKKAESSPDKNKSTMIDFETHEIEFLLKLIGNTNFQGKEVMTLYDIIAKLQNCYLKKKGK